MQETACNVKDPGSIPRSGRSPGEGNGKPLQYSCHENPTNNMNSMKRQKDMKPEDESPRLEGIQYATGGQWRAITNSSRKNTVVGTKLKHRSDVDVYGSES